MKLRWRGRSLPRTVLKKSPNVPTPAWEPVAMTVVPSFAEASTACAGGAAAGTGPSRWRLAACAVCCLYCWWCFYRCYWFPNGKKDRRNLVRDLISAHQIKNPSAVRTTPLPIRSPTFYLSHLGGTRGREASCQQRDTWLQRTPRRTGG